jgi:hypothetical protein
MIRKHYSLQVAEAMLAILTVEENNRDLVVESYQNGREQGYCVYDEETPIGVNTYRYAYFAQARTSDQIVVYVSSNGCLQSIDDDAYKTAKYFMPHEYVDAARYILDMLGSNVKNS